MAANKKQGFQEVICEKDVYLFKGDFNFLAELEGEIGDLMDAYESISRGECKLSLIKSVMEAAIHLKNGGAVLDLKAEVEDLIVRNGIQECHILCQHILTYAMIGDVKKSQLLKLKPNRLTQIITEPFLLENLKNRQYLWTYHLLISGVSVCISFSLFALLFA